jgi:hypothetical protein
MFRPSLARRTKHLKLRHFLSSPVQTQATISEAAKGGAVEFRTLSIQPRPFLGAKRLPVRLRTSRRRRTVAQGRVVGAVIGDQLYLIMFDAARSHYYDAALPDYEAIVASARLRG